MEKKFELESYTVFADARIEVREREVVYADDGSVFASRAAGPRGIEPGDDYSSEAPMLRNVVEKLHTAEVLEFWRLKREVDKVGLSDILTTAGAEAHAKKVKQRDAAKLAVQSALTKPS